MFLEDRQAPASKQGKSKDRISACPKFCRSEQNRMFCERRRSPTRQAASGRVFRGSVLTALHSYASLRNGFAASPPANAESC